VFSDQGRYIVQTKVAELLDTIDPDRIVRLAMDWLSVPSPTGHTRQASELFAQYYRDLGFVVETYPDYPDAPGVAARWAARAEGPTLQLDGHIDHIPVGHPPPTMIDGVIHGRGACDMKGPLAALAEAVRVIVQAKVPLRGGLLCTTHGMHEAPHGWGEALSAMVRRGVHGNAALVAEGPSDYIALAGRGSAIYDLHITRQGQVEHELHCNHETPAWAAIRAGAEIERMRAELAAGPARPYVGPESIFIGQVHVGDFYNRVPTEAYVQGTRRFFSNHPSADVRRELEARLRPIVEAAGCRLKLDFQLVREGYEVSPDERLIQSLRRAMTAVDGREPPYGAMSAVGDVSIFVNEAKIPAVYAGADLSTAHADREYIRLDKLVRAARVYLLTIVNYLGAAE
jgi:acetylornithine deacetylase/succinyl-diaminopimelate desuccinylase-like protein